MERWNKKRYWMMAVCLLAAVSVTACANDGAVNVNTASENDKSDTSVILDEVADESGLSRNVTWAGNMTYQNVNISRFPMRAARRIPGMWR